MQHWDSEKLLKSDQVMAQVPVPQSHFTTIQVSCVLCLVMCVMSRHVLVMCAYFLVTAAFLIYLGNYLLVSFSDYTLPACLPPM